MKQLPELFAAATKDGEDLIQILNDTPPATDETITGFTAGEVESLLQMIFDRPEGGICSFALLVVKHPEHRLGVISNLPEEQCVTLFRVAAHRLSPLERE